MPYIATTTTKKLASKKKRIRLVAGGTSAGKTISIEQLLMDDAMTDAKPTLTSIVSESFPHIRRGSMRDFQNIMQEHGYWEDRRWSKTDFTYTFPLVDIESNYQIIGETGSQIEFFSADQPQKVRGPRRDRLFCNEVNNIARESWEQLLLRTKEYAWADWNPVLDFYMYEEYGLVDEPGDGTEPYATDTDVDFIIATYKDNEALDPAIVAEIEKRRKNKQWFRVYGKGLRGEVEGKVFTNWYIEDDIPHEARLERRGLDFGYSNDPTAIVDVYYYNGGYILDEQLYQKGMSNKQIADVIKNLDKPQTMVVCDSSEPKSIDELKLYGINAQPAQKGPGSILQGIQYLQDQQISLTERSINLRKEYRNYMWKTDKEGKILNVPEDIWNHALDACFAPDTLVHTTEGKIAIKDLVGKEGYLYSRDGRIEKFHHVRPTRYDAETCIIEFTNSARLEVTPDHKLLMEDNSWKEAGSLLPLDMIQSDIYGRTDLQRQHLPALSWRTLLQSWTQKVTPGCLGALQWSYSNGLSYPPQGSQSKEQRYSQSGTQGQALTPQRPYDTAAPSRASGTGSKDTTAYEEVAHLRSWYRVAQAAWYRCLQQAPADNQAMRSLPQRIYDYAVRRISKVLQPKLQDESQTAQVARITRGFQPVTYDLEVDNTHCLLANGIVAHNCRYAFESLRPNTVNKAPATPTWVKQRVGVR